MVVSTKWGTVPLRQLTFLLQYFTCRRAMINKLWCRKLSRAWNEPRPDPPHPRAFSEPQCQSYVSAWYLTYRCLIFLSWTSIIVCSIWEFGSWKPIGKSHLWPIYLTNWDLALGLIQALLGLLIVLRRWNLQKTADFDPSNLTFGKVERIYWVTYTVTCSLAVSVTGTYWVTVHDPKIHRVDPLNIMLHVCNSLLMIIDLAVTSIPIRLKHFWWCTVVVMTYVTFTITYYAAGGLDKNGHRYIYKVLNWEKPGVAIVVSFGGTIFAIAVHCLMCLASTLRYRFYNKSSEYLQQDINTESKIKQLEIV